MTRTFAVHLHCLSAKYHTPCTLTHTPPVMRTCFCRFQRRRGDCGCGVDSDACSILMRQKRMGGQMKGVQDVGVTVGREMAV